MSEGGQMPTFRRMPKRGFGNARFTKRDSIVNVASLEERYEEGAHVSPQSLQEVGLIWNPRDPVKILGEGQLTKRLIVDAAKYSATAREKIQAAGGEARVS
jgi:large subunit ribosomal protein L15